MALRAAKTAVTAVPAGTTARYYQNGRRLVATSPRLGVTLTARAVSSGTGKSGAAACAPTGRSITRKTARAATEVDECRVARRRSLLLHPDDRSRLFSCFAGGGEPAGDSRSGTVKGFPRAGTPANIISGSAFRSNSESRSSSSDSSSGGRGDGVAVVDHGTQKHLVAARGLDAGHVVFSRVEGSLVGEATRHSLQVGEGLHLEVDSIMKFCDHACEPNCQLEVVLETGSAATGDEAQTPPYLRVQVRGTRIDENEPLTIDYNTFEVDMSSPFDCHCGADRCRGRVSGFANLPPAVQKEYLDGYWTARSTAAPIPGASAAADGGVGVGGAVTEGSGRAAATGPAPLTDTVKKWANDNSIITPV